MTVSEQRTIDLLTRLAAHQITVERTAELLGLSSRQVQRKLKRFLAEGVSAIPHGNRRRKPHNILDPDTRTRVLALTSTGGPYHGFNVCHTRDLLAANDDIQIGRSTLHKLLHPKAPPEVKDAKPARGVVRRRRLRKAASGMMVQIDGSPHDWLEGRGPRLCLMGAIDDADNHVLHAHFRPNEDAAGYLWMFRAIAIEYGLPASYYHDKHTILRSPKKATIEDELAGQIPMSHVQKVLHDLGVESIAAHSPQAKGRIERLWSTFQDRLVKEMRLAGISTMEQANAFLPAFIAKHNAQFGIEAADPNSAFIALEPGFDLDYYFSIQETRTVKADHTLSFEGKVYQITAASRSRSLAGQKVSARVNPEGQLHLYDGKRRLDYRLASAAPAKAKPVQPSPEAPKSPLETPKSQPCDPAAAVRKRAWLHTASP
ncbi:transposase [Capsulimonas corticalis]|uniref:Transposase n=1 Tax=Capsulimonas corticalis TaxID=2219043 RepID=A0A9N7L6T1_9BACT|nr:ISNCY family transposase [Capsulimonas corticalis]BDI31923.1 transposase [Capsulimonas corticalis]